MSLVQQELMSEIAVAPDGSLFFIKSEGEDDIASTKAIERQFAASQAAGLFALATAKSSVSVAPSLAFWRDFAGRYVSHLCHTPEGADEEIDSIEPPTPADFESVIASLPPMTGAEYLNAEILRTVWINLDRWVREQVVASGLGLTGWLKQHAPLWHQIGRVCFHLAENKRDQDYPFAFLATYAPRLSRSGKIQYQPLSKALIEYAGERNKKALVHLLSPVHLASERSDFVKELVATGEIFHPLMWTPAEAFRFLKEVPLLEDSGVLVRLPDWWRKRPRPRVNVTIGDTNQNLLGLKTLLDFKVEVTLGDAKLSQEGATLRTQSQAAH